MTTTEQLQRGPAEPGEAISDIAERVGVSAHTLRYYERIGLLQVGRDSAGRRLYTDADVRRIVFITRLRLTDMPIRQIQRYFALVDAGPATEPDRLELLLRHRESVRARLVALTAALDAVDFKIASYGGAASL